MLEMRTLLEVGWNSDELGGEMNSEIVDIVIVVADCGSGKVWEN